VIMSVIVFVAVIMMTMMIMLVIMPMLMTVPRFGGCGLRLFKFAGVGFEWRFNVQDFRAELFQLLFQLFIAHKADFFWLDFSRKAALASEIGKARKNARIGMARLRQLFRRCDDFYQAAIVHHQRIATAQMY